MILAFPWQRTWESAAAQGDNSSARGVHPESHCWSECVLDVKPAEGHQCSPSWVPKKLSPVPCGARVIPIHCEPRLLLGKFCPDVCSLPVLCQGSPSPGPPAQPSTEPSPPPFHRVMPGTHWSATTKPTASSPTGTTTGLASTLTSILTFPGSTAS